MSEELVRDIEAVISKRAKSYTPEWRFDPSDPDIGSALAIIYARMLAGTCRRFPQIEKKNRIAFLNRLGAGLLPAVPSQGYVSFSLVNEEAEGCEVPALTRVIAEDASLPEGQTAFETQEDVCVIPAEPDVIFQACGRTDRICRMYDRAAEAWKPFPLFWTGGENLQSHVLYFSQDVAFADCSELYVELEFFSKEKTRLKPELLDVLADGGKAVFSYGTQSGWEPFAEVIRTEEGLRLYKRKEQPAFARREVDGKERCWVRCQLLDYFAGSGIQLEKLKLASWNQEILPDTVYGAQQECDVRKYFPFGERLEPYQEVYFGSEEVLSKKGARVTFGTGIRFARIPLDTNTNSDFQWEWVMKRSDMKVDLEFDVTIASVIWEYYNGSGWTRLFPEGENSGVFGPDEQRGYWTLEFVCPQDIEKVLVNAVETYYIRARISKINNLYKQTGNYIVPVLENTSFCYSYRSGKLHAGTIVFENNLEKQSYTETERSASGGMRPFWQDMPEKSSILMGFSVPPVGSPVRMLFDVENTRQLCASRLQWEYWNGKKWAPLNLIDETENFSVSGLVTFFGNADFAHRELFGKTCCWIRVCDQEEQYREHMSPNGYPILQKICMNTTKVKNVSRSVRESLQMEIYQENKSFPLQEKNICEVSVYVDEKGYLSAEEQRQLMQQERLDPEYGENKIPEKLWVKWERVSDFSDSLPSDRHFVLDASAGKLLFGNGTHGKIPYRAGEENIRVIYKCGGGEATNLQAGAISRMEEHIGYITAVSNPLDMAGGCDAETLDDAVKRSSAAVRHQNRAVSARDYEELALCSARELAAVRCFTGFDGEGNRMGGAVTLVVLPRQYWQSGVYFAALKEKILRYMDSRIGAVLLQDHRFFVTLPELLVVRLFIELTVENFNKAFSVKKEILNRLQAFLSPERWKIGSFPNAMQIQNQISDIKGIVFIRSIRMGVYTADSAVQQEIDIDMLQEHRYRLPVNGEHEIRIYAG